MLARLWIFKTVSHLLTNMICHIVFCFGDMSRVLFRDLLVNTLRLLDFVT